MAESVDALVSNTSGVTSIPVRPRVWVQKERLSNELQLLSLFICLNLPHIFPTCAINLFSVYFHSAQIVVA